MTHQQAEDFIEDTKALADHMVAYAGKWKDIASESDDSVLTDVQKYYLTQACESLQAAVAEM